MAQRHRRSVGRKIRALREARGWTQKELADHIPSPKVDSQYVSNWERGVHLPEKHLDDLAAALEVEPGDVMAGLREGDAGESPLDLLPRSDGSAEIIERLTRIEESIAELRAEVTGEPAIVAEQTADAIEREAGSARRRRRSA